MYALHHLLAITATPLSQEEADALRVVLTANGVKPGEVSLEDSQSTLEGFNICLAGKGYKELATNLRAKLNEGLSNCASSIIKQGKLAALALTVPILYSG